MKLFTDFFLSDLGNSILVAVISATVGGIISFLSFNYKLKKEIKSGFQEETGKKIAESLFNVREIAKQANEIEKYGIEEAKDFKAFELGIYPSIMTNRDILCDFQNNISVARHKDEYNLTRKSAVHLYIMQNYLLEMMSFVGKNKCVDKLPEIGCILIFDIQKWQHSFYKQIIKDINRNNIKFQKQRGVLWEIEKKKKKRKFYDKSNLVLMQKNKEDIPKKQKATYDMITNFMGNLLTK